MNDLMAKTLAMQGIEVSLLTGMASFERCWHLRIRG
jgi:hypothetical protein